MMEYDLFSAYLLRDERIIWQGENTKGSQVVPRLPSVIFGTIFTIIAISMASAFISLESGFFSIIPIAFIGFGIFIVFSSLINIGKHYYAVTDQRVLIIKKGKRNQKLIAKF